MGGDASSLVEKALNDRPDLLQAANSVEMASLDKALAVLGNRPSITAGAGLGFKNGLFTVDNTDLNALEFNWSVGVALNVPIFDGFMAANRTAEAEGSLAAAKDEAEDLGEPSRHKCSRQFGASPRVAVGWKTQRTN